MSEQLIERRKRISARLTSLSQELRQARKQNCREWRTEVLREMDDLSSRDDELLEEIQELGASPAAEPRPIDPEGSEAVVLLQIQLPAIVSMPDGRHPAFLFVEGGAWFLVLEKPEKQFGI